MKALIRLVLTAAAVLLIGTGCMEQQVSYKSQVRPILQKNCVGCHSLGGVGYQAAGLDLSSYDTLMRGTRFGSVVKPGASYASTLIRLTEHHADRVMNMPRGKNKLAQQDLALLKHWIDQGAKNN